MTDGFIFPIWLMLLIGGIIIIAILAIIFCLFKDVFTAAFSKVITTDAKLTSKYEEEYVTQKVFAGGGAVGSSVSSGLAEKGKEYFLTFEPDNGKLLTFIVSKNVYDETAEGGHGKLTYKGKKFISYNGSMNNNKPNQGSGANTFVGLNSNL